MATMPSNPTPLDVERYIQIDALRTVLYTVVSSPTDRLFPNVIMDNLELATTDWDADRTPFSSGELLDLFLDAGDDALPPSPSTLAREARANQLAARQLRQIADSADDIEAEADRLDTLAENKLREASGARPPMAV